MSVRAKRLLSCGLLGASAALLVSCGSSGKLIPVANSEPLQKDFEEVARAAENGHGSCASTEAAIRKAERDFDHLPASLDAGLRRRLSEGISTLRGDALGLCVQPSATPPPRTTTSTPASTTPTPTQTTPTQTNTNTTTTTGPGGGTPAKESEAEAEAEPRHKGKDGEPNGAGGAPSGGEGGKSTRLRSAGATASRAGWASAACPPCTGRWTGAWSARWR
jgi:hypothetical protein